MAPRIGLATGRRARWLPLLIIAPGAAGLFGAATSWATHTVPHPATANSVPSTSIPAGTSSTSSAVDAARAAAVRRAHLDALHQAAVLRRQLAQLQKLIKQQQAAAAGGAAGIPAVSGSGGSGSGSGGGGGTVANSSGGGSAPPAASVPAPPAVQAPAPPPVQAVTGASGVKK